MLEGTRESRVVLSRNICYKLRSGAQPVSKRTEKWLERNRKREKSGCVRGSGSTHLHLCTFNSTLSVSFEREIFTLIVNLNFLFLVFLMLIHWFTLILNWGGGASFHLVANDFRWIKWVYCMITGLPSSSWCTVCLQNSSLGFRTEGYVFMAQRWGVCKPTHELM